MKKEPFKKKVENYFYHYKYHTIIGIALLFFVISFGYTLVKGQIERVQEANRPPADVEILLFGNYHLIVEKPIVEDELTELFPGWDIRLNAEYAPPEPKTHEDIGAQQRSMVVIATERPDMYIFDEHQLKKFINDGTFHPYQDEFIEQFPENKLHSGLSEEGELQVYGIDISDSPIFKDTELADASKIAVIRDGAHSVEKSLELIEKIANK